MTGYHVDITPERKNWAFEHRDPIEERYFESIVGKLGERTVRDAFPGIHDPTSPETWEWDLESVEGQTIEVKTKLSPRAKQVHIRTRGRYRDEMADLYVICGYDRYRERVWLLGYLTKRDVYQHGYHSKRTEHDDTLTVDFEYMRPVEDLFDQYGRA